MPDPTLTALAKTLGSAELTGWRGLPPHLEPEQPDEAPALVTLGSEFVPAELVHLDDPAEGARARGWLRDGYIALLDVAWERSVDAARLDTLGEPAERADVIDGLARLPHGEWLYPDAWVSPRWSRHRRTAFRRVDGLRPVRPCRVRYRRDLQPDFATHRRPLDRQAGV